MAYNMGYQILRISGHELGIEWVNELASARAVRVNERVRRAVRSKQIGCSASERASGPLASFRCRDILNQRALFFHDPRLLFCCPWLPRAHCPSGQWIYYPASVLQEVRGHVWSDEGCERKMEILASKENALKPLFIQTWPRAWKTFKGECTCLFGSDQEQGNARSIFEQVVAGIAISLYSFRRDQEHGKPRFTEECFGAFVQTRSAAWKPSLPHYLL